VADGFLSVSFYRVLHRGVPHGIIGTLER
jgi:hypothetical protein